MQIALRSVGALFVGILLLLVSWFYVVVAHAYGAPGNAVYAQSGALGGVGAILVCAGVWLGHPRELWLSVPLHAGLAWVLLSIARTMEPATLGLPGTSLRYLPALAFAAPGLWMAAYVFWLVVRAVIAERE